MDNTGKRLFLAMSLSLLVLLVFSYFGGTKPGPRPDTKQTASGTAPEKLLQQPSGAEAQTPPALGKETNLVAAAEDNQSPTEEALTTLETETFMVTFSNLGGCIKQLGLKEGQASRQAVLSRATAPGQGIGIIEFEGFGPSQATSPYVVEQEGRTILCRTMLAPGIEVIKEFDFNGPAQTIGIKVTIKNTAHLDRQVKYRLTGALSLSSKEYSRGDQGYLLINTAITGQKKTKDVPGKLRSGQRSYPGPVEWTAVKEKYFCQVIKPDDSAQTAGSFSLVTASMQLATGIETRAIVVPQSSVITQAYKLYAGPLDPVKAREFGTEGVVDYGFLSGISQILLFLLRLFYKLVPNWGVAIIAVSVLIKGLLHPLTAKSMRSMKEMQALQPHMVRVREEYKDNPQKMNKEMMELYRKHKVNPLGGCLPMLLQMPVFIALYQTLSRSIELRGARFLWIKDLSLPDEIYRLPFSVPLLGSSINLLPLLMAIAMAVQQKFTPTAGGVQESQQKMMAVMMPILFGFIFYGFPSGLVLYWLVNTALSAVHQYFVMKKPVVITA